MSKYITAVLLGFFLFPLAADVSEIFGWSTFLRVPGYGSMDAFIGNCTKDVAKNGHGWVFVVREYYNCGKVSIAISDLIYGETTK